MEVIKIANVQFVFYTLAILLWYTKYQSGTWLLIIICLIYLACSSLQQEEFSVPIISNFETIGITELIVWIIQKPGIV